MRNLTIPAAAMLLALAGCDRLGLGGGAGGEETVSGAIANGGAAAPAAAGPSNQVAADAGVTTSRSFAGLGGNSGGGKDPAAAAPAATPASVRPELLVGRWTDDGDCKRDVEFRADGSFRSHNGGEGRWALAGDLLTLTGAAGSFRLRLQSVSPEAMVTVNDQGTIGRSTRC